MKTNRASKRFTVVIFILTAFMMLFAWVHSCFPADLSSQESEGFMALISGLFKLFGITHEMSGLLIRKLAHFTEFSAIGALLLSCAYCFDRVRPHRYFVQVLFSGLLSAVIDETIQLFSEGRAGMITDVWIDMGGVVFGSALAWLFYAVVRRVKHIS